MKRKGMFLAVLVFLTGIMCVAYGTAVAQPTNGNFETGDLTGWGWIGDIGVADSGGIGNVISGLYTGFLTTENLSGTPAYANMCSWLYSSNVYPAFSSSQVVVTFRMRYKTNETVPNWDGSCNDPFSARVATSNGNILTLFIERGGITPGPGASVRNMATGAYILPPTMPPFSGSGLYLNETPTLEVRQQFSYEGCDPVFFKFGICDECDDEVASAVFIDDVHIELIPIGARRGAAGAPCL
jgi:hypothetical protein